VTPIIAEAKARIDEAEPRLRTATAALRPLGAPPPAPRPGRARACRA
jgi:hypothetical protein